MTLKQFFQLGIGVGIAVVIYRLPLPGIITVPLAIIAILVGVALAFVPINGRPFSQWIVAFIKAVYSPTEFYWNVTGTVASNQLPITNKSKTTILSPVTPKTETKSEPVKIKLPEIDYKVAQKVADVEHQTPKTQPQTTGMVDKVVLIKQKPKEETREEEVIEINWPPRKIDSHQSTVVSHRPPANPVPKTEFKAPTTDLNIPLDTENSIPLPPAPAGVTISAAPKQVFYVSQPKQTIPVERRKTDEKVAVAPTTNKIISPTNPNILAGLILDGHDQVVEWAILEVVDSSGIHVRALRSNKLGQFQTGSPLSNGKYVIEVEKEALLFDSVSVEAKGAIIEPIVIKAKF